MPDDTPTAAEGEPREPARRRAVTVISFVLALAGLLLVLLREVFGALGHRVHPVVAAASGIVIAVTAAWSGANALAAKLPAGWLGHNVKWLAPVATLLVAVVFWVLPAPVERTPTKQMTSDTNVAVVDFLLPASSKADRAKASAEVGAIVAGDLAQRAGPDHIAVERYEERAPIDDPARRDAWVARFSVAANAHIVVGGRMELVRGVGTRITPIVYVRPDAVPDAPELARWLEASTPIVTQYDVTGQAYGPAERDRLAKDLADVVTDLVLFTRATDAVRAGRPDDAEHQLERLSASGSGIIPSEQVRLFQADAALMQSQAVTGADRDAVLGRAAQLLAADASFPRARFALAEVHLQQATGSGCGPGSVQGDALAAVSAEYERLDGADLPALVRLKARLGALKAQACARRAGLSPAGEFPASSADIRAAAARLEADARGLNGPEAVAARPVVARALVLWPEVVLSASAGQDRAAAAADLERALAIERRPERAGTYLLELALLEAQLCHRDEAAGAVRDATDAFGAAAAHGRLPAARSSDLTKEVDDGVTAFLARCAA
jgi:hypothetical protein